MAQSPILAIPLLSANQSNKETTINDAISFLEQASNAAKALDLSTGDVSLSALDVQRFALLKSAGATAPRTVTVPNTLTKTLTIDNSSSAYPITVTTGATNLTIAANTVAMMFINLNSIVLMNLSNDSGDGGSGISGGFSAAHAYWRFVAVAATTGNQFIRVGDIQFLDNQGNDLTANGGTAFASTGTAASAFDSDPSTYWDSGSLSGGTRYVGWQFPTEERLYGFSFFVNPSEGNSLSEFRIEYSDDGTAYNLAYQYNASVGDPIVPPSTYTFTVPTPEGQVPAGGTTGQVLTKTSNTDYDAEWATPTAGGGGSGGIPDAPSDSKTYGRKNAGWVEVAATATAAVPGLVVFLGGVLTASEVLFRFVAPSALTLKAANAKASAGIAAAASTVLTLKKNGANAGTLTFAASGTTPTIAFTADIVLAAGDILSLHAPSSADAALADIAITLNGN